MIWVIGDIHGKADLLNNVLESIRKNEKTSVFGPLPVEKIIFIGDYIDRGPDSKEVLDAIMDLEYEKVCLAGNHEDIYLQYNMADPSDTKKQKFFWRAWWNNRAYQTHKSILKDIKYKELLDNFNDHFHCFASGGTPKTPISSLVFPEKYDRFLRELCYSHREVFKINDCQVGFSFFHSLPAWDQSLEDQLKIRSIQDFLTYLDTEIPHFRNCMTSQSEFSDFSCKSDFRLTKVNLEYTFIWLRTYALRWGYGPDVVVHGHTPTHLYRDAFYKERRDLDFKSLLFSYNPDLAWPFLWSRAHRSGYKTPKRLKIPKSTDLAFREIEFNSPRGGAVEAINIDTGAVYGQALTAIGLSDETLSQGLIPVISAFDETNKHFPGLCSERVIRVQNFVRKKDDRKPLVKMMTDLTSQINDLRQLNEYYNVNDFHIGECERKDGKK
jgi:hypothetical protein